VKNYILLIVVFISANVSAQNTIRFSQLNFAQGVNNPAAIAFDGPIMGDLIARNQWLGVEGAPTTIAFNGQYEINEDMAVGLNMFHDRIGAEITNSFAAQFAYRAKIDYERVFSFGISAGLDNSVLNFTGAQTTDFQDPTFARGGYSQVFFNAAVGIFYNAPKFYAGFSVPKLFQNTREGAEKGFRVNRWHYYASTGFYLGQGKYVLNPHIQIKLSQYTPMTADLILRNTFVNRFSIVVGYRTENSLIAGVDFLVSDNLRIGYSFNYDLGPLSKVKGASNELYLGVAFPYDSDKYNFSKRRYIRKGRSKTDYNKNSQRKQRKSGRKFGRKWS
tara:strand:+ start:42213 stop:43208 length:996 start_codon:yes stop_codon:yes gene_type:complete